MYLPCVVELTVGSQKAHFFIGFSSLDEEKKIFHILDVLASSKAKVKEFMVPVASPIFSIGHTPPHLRFSSALNCRHLPHPAHHDLQLHGRRQALPARLILLADHSTLEAQVRESHDNCLE